MLRSTDRLLQPAVGTALTTSDLVGTAAPRSRAAPVWTTSAGTELSRPNLAGRVLKPVAKAAGLTVERDGELVAWVTFHTFRHTCASLLFEAGRNVRQVAEWLGHADPAYTLRRYVHLLDAGLGDADFLDAELGDGGNRVATRGPQIAADRALAGRA